MKQCLECEDLIDQSKPEEQKFCNLVCSGRYSAKHNDKNPFGRKKDPVYKDCQECGTLFLAMESRQKYCGRSCAARFNNRAKAKRIKKDRPDCLFCAGQIEHAGKVYCSRECAWGHKSQKIIDDWLLDPLSANIKHGLSRTITIYLKEQAGWKCQSPNCCVPGGWSEVHPVTGSVPVEIDHIDGDAYNNHPDNLIVLCPNCHALTANYRALNKNSGRTYRSDYNQYEKK